MVNLEPPSIGSRSWWLEQHGKVITLDGVQCRIEASTHRAIYPYDHESFTLYATPLDKESPAYRESKAKLGDHWSYCLLESDELRADAIRQLAN